MSAAVSVEGFGEKLKDIRKSQGLTQKEVAKKLGFTSYQAYARYETRKYAPKEETLKRLSDAIGVNLISKIIPKRGKRMSVGDKMAYNVLEAALEKMDALMQEGYAVELRYAHGQALLIILEVPETT